MTDFQDLHQQRKYIKIVLVGQSGVGKSNIISRYVDDKFSFGTNTTIGLQFSEKPIFVKGQNLLLQIWDTAGQQRFRALNKTFYRNSSGALVIFDLADRKSFDNLHKWIDQLRENLTENSVFLLIGNKCDKKQQAVTVKQVLEFAKKEQMGYLETSAALNVNIKQAFELLSVKIIEKANQLKKSQSPHQIIEMPVNASKQKKKAQRLSGINQVPEKRKCC